MYQEVLLFDKDMPFLVKIQNIRRYPIHWHENATEILLPLNGSIEVVSNFERAIVRQGEFFFVNNRSVHSLRSDSGTMAAVFYFDLDHFENQFQYIKHMFFRSSSYQENPMEKTDEIDDDIRRGNKTKFRNLLTGLLAEMTEGKIPAVTILQKYEYQLAYSMIYDFNWLQFLQKGNHFISSIHMDRYHRIVKYLDENYFRKITLDDIVSMEFITKTYFSHFWKDLSSYSFQERINYERVLKSEAMLLSGMSIALISERCGFSDVKYYYRNFKRWYGCMPLEHRKRCESYTKLGAAYENLPLGSAAEILAAYTNEYFVVQCVDAEDKDLAIFFDNYMKIKYLHSTDKKTVRVSSEFIVVNLFQTYNYHIENEAVVFNWNNMDLWVNLSAGLNSTLHIKLVGSDLDNAFFHAAIEKFIEQALYRYGMKTVQKWQFIIKFKDSDICDPANNMEKSIVKYIPEAIINYLFEF